jgi:hypothetical protein
LAPSKDHFCVRECYLPLMLSYLHPKLLEMVRTRPLVPVAVGRDRYSFGYSPRACRYSSVSLVSAPFWHAAPLDANHRK